MSDGITARHPDIAGSEQPILLWSADIPFADSPGFLGADQTEHRGTLGAGTIRIRQVMTESLPILFRTIVRVVYDLALLNSLVLRSRAQLVAEHLFLRKPLALRVQCRQFTPHRMWGC
jgi:hypothetical protein